MSKTEKSLGFDIKTLGVSFYLKNSKKYFSCPHKKAENFSRSSSKTSAGLGVKGLAPGFLVRPRRNQEWVQSLSSYFPNLISVLVLMVGIAFHLESRVGNLFRPHTTVDNSAC